MPLRFNFYGQPVLIFFWEKSSDSLKIEKKIVKKVGIFWFSHLWKRLGTPSFDWSVAVYKLQNLDFGIAERSRAVREAGVEFSDQGVASEKSSDSLKIEKKSWKKSEFSGFHTYGNDSELQVSIDLWPCISSKTSILASLSALEQSERLALNFQTRGLLLKKVPTRWKSKKNREKSRNFLVFTPMETTRNSKFRLICGRV